ncbi:MAG: hypothetical protein WB239_17520, partial [Acidimicrobiia bacterium]
MTDDELRNRLAASNPVPPSHAVDPITSDRARAQLEEIMSTATTQPRTRPGRMRLTLAVAAALVVVVGGATLYTGLGTSQPPMVLTADGGDAMASCIRFDPAILADMSPAFAGTVTEMTDSTVTLEVDHWYTGGDTGTVEIRYTPGFEALIGTPSFDVGQRYLITATDGVVNGCGYSGPATADLEAAFNQA